MTLFKIYVDVWRNPYFFTWDEKEWFKIFYQSLWAMCAKCALSWQKGKWQCHEFKKKGTSEVKNDWHKLVCYAIKFMCIRHTNWIFVNLKNGYGCGYAMGGLGNLTIEAWLQVLKCSNRREKESHGRPRTERASMAF